MTRTKKSHYYVEYATRMKSLCGYKSYTHKIERYLASPKFTCIHCTRIFAKLEELRRRGKSFMKFASTSPRSQCMDCYNFRKDIGASKIMYRCTICKRTVCVQCLKSHYCEQNHDELSEPEKPTIQRLDNQ